MAATRSPAAMSSPPTTICTPRCKPCSLRPREGVYAALRAAILRALIVKRNQRDNSQGESMDTELHRRRRRSGLLGLASLAALAWAGAAGAQQITTPNGAVTIDYGVLNSAGQGQATDGYGGQSSYPYGQPASPYGQPASPYGQSAGTYGQPIQLQPSWPYNGQSAYNQVTGTPSPYGQGPYPYPYGQPAYGYRRQASAQQPLYPPPQYPVSSP